MYGRDDARPSSVELRITRRSGLLLAKYGQNAPPPLIATTCAEHVLRTSAAILSQPFWRVVVMGCFTKGPSSRHRSLKLLDLTFIELQA